MSLLKRGAYWYARLGAGEDTAAMRKACEAWREESDEHDKAFRDIVELSSACEQLEDDPDIAALRRQALKKSFRKPWWSAPKMAAAAAGLALCFAVTLAYYSEAFNDPVSEGAESILASSSSGAMEKNADPDASTSPAPFLYRTKTGERSVITLVDGSVITMNTDTEFKTRFTGGQRDVILLKGQAVFKVAKDAARPFRVFAGGQIVTAIGTEFEVRTEDSSLSVTLIEGKVAVSALDLAGPSDGASPSAPSLALEPGQRLVASGDGPPVITTPNLGKALSWREGRLEFQNEKLSSAIREFNRYSARKLVINDPSLGDLRIGGSFKTDSMANFVLALEALYPVVTETDEATGEIAISWE